MTFLLSVSSDNLGPEYLFNFVSVTGLRDNSVTQMCDDLIMMEADFL